MKLFKVYFSCSRYELVWVWRLNIWQVRWYPPFPVSAQPRILPVSVAARVLEGSFNALSLAEGYVVVRRSE